MECIVCGNDTNFSMFLRAKRHHPSYWKCKDCGLVFAFPQVLFNYKKYKFNPISELELDTRLANYELRYDIMQKYVTKKKSSLLDIGAYTGIFLKLIRSKNIDAIGLDPCSDAALFGRMNFNVEILPLSLEDFESEKRFDIITMFNVFEHVVDPVYTITKIKRILNESGLLVMEIPHIFTLPALLSFGYWHQFEVHHNWFFNKMTIKKFLNGHGFLVKYIAFVPKVVTLAKLFDGLMTSFKIYTHVSRKKYLQFTKTNFYKFLNRVKIKVKLNEYLLVISRKDENNKYGLGIDKS